MLPGLLRIEFGNSAGLCTAARASSLECLTNRPTLFENVNVDGPRC